MADAEDDDDAAGREEDEEALMAGVSWTRGEVQDWCRFCCQVCVCFSVSVCVCL